MRGGELRQLGEGVTHDESACQRGSRACPAHRVSRVKQSDPRDPANPKLPVFTRCRAGELIIMLSDVAIECVRDYFRVIAINPDGSAADPAANH